MNKIPDYYDGLFKQFKEQKGLVGEFSLFDWTDEFFDWLKNMVALKELYGQFLIDSGFIDSSASIVELEKGRYDSLAPFLRKKGFNCSSVGWHYQNTFSRNFKNRYHGYLSQLNGQTFILYDDYLSCFTKPNCCSYFNNDITHFITHYPYYDINSLSYLLAASKNVTVILGCFGKKNDVDYNKKRQWLIDIISVMNYYYHVKHEEIYGEVDNQYVYAVKSLIGKK